MHPAFVGRQDEVGALRALCAGARRWGRPVLGLVEGAPGAGKTRLLAAVEGGDGAPERVLLGGFEPEMNVPLASVIGLMRLLSSSLAHGAVLQRALGSATATRAPPEPLQLFEAAHLAVSERGGLLLVVDDLQWVDESSQAMLHYLVRAAESAARPLVLLAATRPAFHAQSFLRSLVRVVDEAERVVRIELGPLARHAGIELCRQLQPGADTTAAAQMWEQAAGSPFWITALAGGGRSTDIDTFLARRLDGAGSEAAFVLALLALAGNPLRPEDAATPTGRTAGGLRDAADRLVQLGIAIETADGFLVAHDLVREAAVRALSPETARAAHHHLALVLARRPATDLPTMLRSLRHRRAAGLDTLEMAQALACSPHRRLLGHAGLRLVDAVAQENTPGSASGLSLRRSVAILAAELGDHQLAMARWSAVSDGAHGSDAVVAELAASRSAMHLGRADEAWALLARARAASASDVAMLIAVDAHEAALEQWLGHRPGAAASAAARAMQRARDTVGDAGSLDELPAPARQGYLQALLAATESAMLEGRPDSMLALADELARVAAGLDDRIRIRAVVDAGLALRWLGRTSDAEHRLRAGWEEARRIALPQATLEVGVIHAKVLYSRGLLGEAAAVLAECRDLGDRMGERGPARAVGAVIAELVDHSLGGWRVAADGLRAAADNEDDPHTRLHAFLERAVLLGRLDPAGAAVQVRRCVDRAVADADRAGCHRCRREAGSRGAEALARIGDVGAATRMLADGSAEPQPSDDRLMAWWSAQAAAAVAAATDRDGAPPLWRAVVDEAERQGMRMEALWARLDLAGLLVRGDRAGAAELLRDAGRAAETMGAVTEQRVADQHLRALGVRTWRRGANASPSPVLARLTEREREVAGLVVSGASNPEIAAALFLSRKTVERHVSNCLGKLGVQNRVQLTAALGASHRPEGPHR